MEKLENHNRLFETLTDLENVSMDLAQAAELLHLLEEHMEGEIQSLTEEPRMVRNFLCRYPMAGALLRTITDSIDRQKEALEGAVSAAYDIYSGTRDTLAGGGTAAAHGGKSAQEKASK